MKKKFKTQKKSSDIVQKRKIYSAFSLIELSISLLIISILVGLSLNSQNLMGYAKILSARSSSANAPFIDNKDLTLWLNATGEMAMASSADGRNLSSMTYNAGVARWTDLKPAIEARINLVAPNTSSTPSYRASSIKTLPAVFFDGNDTMQATSINPNQLFSDSKTTIFIVEKFNSGSADFISWINGSNQVRVTSSDGSNLTFYFANNPSISYSFSSANDFKSLPKILTLTKNGSVLNIKINGSSVATNNNATSNITSSNSGTLSIGSSLNGFIGEIIVFKSALIESEIKKIEDYLSEKWGIATTAITESSTCFCNGSSIANGATCQVNDCPAGQSGNRTLTCNNGILSQTSSNCGSAFCSVGSGYGFSAKSNLTPGNNSFACDTGFSGNIGYYCPSSGGNAQIQSNSCTAITCNLLAGTGYLAQSVSYGNNTFPCNVAGYTGSVSYNCTNNGSNINGISSCTAVTCNLIAGIGYSATTVNYGSGSVSCNTGYTGGPINYNCVSGGNINGSGSCTPITCNIVAESGFTGATVNKGSGTVNCNVAGYSGTLSYNCINNGSNINGSGSCTTISCNLLAGTGYSATTVNYGSGSVSCNTGYTGGPINYNCVSGGNINGQGTCTPITCYLMSYNGNGYQIVSGRNVNYGSGVINCKYSGTLSYNCVSSGSLISGTPSQDCW